MRIRRINYQHCYEIVGRQVSRQIDQLTYTSQSIKLQRIVSKMINILMISCTLHRSRIYLVITGQCINPKKYYLSGYDILNNLYYQLIATICNTKLSNLLSILPYIILLFRITINIILIHFCSLILSSIFFIFKLQSLQWL